MESDTAVIYHMFILCGKNLFFGTKVKCQGDTFFLNERYVGISVSQTLMAVTWALVFQKHSKI